MNENKFGSVFERREMKYRLSPAQYRELMEALRHSMRRDRYGLHTICSVYYDSEDFALIRHSLDKPKFKEKMRMRSYGVPCENDNVFVELKKKLDGVTYKRRIALPLREAKRYLNQGIRPEGGGGNLGEVDCFLRRRPLFPKAVLCYDRTALSGVDQPDLRITIDENIRWRDNRLDLAAGDRGSLLLPSGERIMEIKTLNALPYRLSRILSELHIYPVSFSKYGAVYREHLIGREEIRRAG